MRSCSCGWLNSYHIPWIGAQVLLFHSIILCYELLRRAKQTDKLPSKCIRAWVNWDEGTMASYLQGIRVLSTELWNWIDCDEQRYDWRQCKHHNLHLIGARESNICNLVLVTAGNDGVFAVCCYSSRRCHLDVQFHNTKCLVTVNNLAAVLCSWDTKRVTQKEHAMNTRKILLLEVALRSNNLETLRTKLEKNFRINESSGRVFW
jgi:hypothetical protein